jgi:lon-related putative ATP-dependent protease
MTKAHASLRDALRVPPADVLITPWAARFIDRKTPQVEPASGIIGQDRALRALTLGIDLEAPGYNVFVCGESGIGRTSTVKDLLNGARRARKPLVDRCYVMNFKDPDHPRLLEFPAGIGVKFRADMEKLVSRLKKEVQRIFDASDYSKRKEKLSSQYERKQRNRVQKFEEVLKKDGFALAQSREGPTAGRPEVVPNIRGKLMAMTELQTMVDEGKFKADKFQKMAAVYEARKAELDAMLKEIRKEGRDFEERLRQLDRDTFSDSIGDLTGEVLERYVPYAQQIAPPASKPPPRFTMAQKLEQYVAELKEDLIENLDAFREAEGQESDGGAERRERYESKVYDYRVNVILDNTGREQCPIVQETSPTFNNLFGAIERPFEDTGHVGAHFTSIKGGALLNADGGFLIVNAVDVFTEPGVWKTMKRTLRHRQLEIQNLDVPGYAPPTALKPEPIVVDVKVIMLGDEEIYRTLHAVEDDFRKIFKVKAEFDTEMDLDRDNVTKYLSFIDRAVREESLLPLAEEAVTAVVAHGIRMTADRRKISMRFSDVADLLREASHFARHAGEAAISRASVQTALREMRDRVGLDEDKLQEEYERGQLLIDTAGSAVGVVNGLTVYDLGDHQFGRPVRITAATAVGRGGIVNVERRAGLSGAVYDKAVLILTGFLMERFGRAMPLNLRASITLEQSYGGIEGDSASSAEIYALLSALSGAPIDQSIAVTGSVNPKGAIQPIGGVSHKIEGFYEVCRARGLTGTQGVLLPRQNVAHLVLKPEVEQAIVDGTFHLYAAATIDEGIEILTGAPAGAADAAGAYPAGSINARAMARLAEMNELLRRSRGPAA